MDSLLRRIDSYCERTGDTFWAEPLNALTNLAFVVAAIVLWRRSAADPWARTLSALLFIIGVGSWLLHTHARAWAAVADSLPIAAFILLYLFIVNRVVLGWPCWLAATVTALFLPVAALMHPLWRAVPVLNVTAGYMPVPLLIAVYAVFLHRSRPAFARGLAAGAALLLVSLLARSLDQTLCPVWPAGTHFLWHLLNAAMLGWMIENYVRQRRAAAGTFFPPEIPRG